MLVLFFLLKNCSSIICFELYHYNDLHICQILRLHIEHVDGNSFCFFLFLDTGRLRPELVSKGFWRFVPKGSNWTRATLSALLFCTMFAGASVALLCLLWVAGVGGEWMEIDGWTYILPKALHFGPPVGKKILYMYVRNRTHGYPNNIPSKVIYTYDMYT